LPESEVAAIQSTVQALVRAIVARKDLRHDIDALHRQLMVIRARYAQPISFDLPLISSVQSLQPRSEQEEYVAEMAQIGVGRMFRDLSLCSPDESLFLVASPLLRIVHDEIEMELENPDSPFARIDRKMRHVQQTYHLPEEVFWLLCEAPKEYRRLHLQWENLAARFVVNIFNQYGESELASLYQNNRTEFQRRFRLGRNLCAHASELWLRRYAEGWSDRQFPKRLAAG
jgi:hypothetical protein